MTSTVQIKQIINLNIKRNPNPIHSICINNEYFMPKIKVQNNYFIYSNKHHVNTCFPTIKFDTSCGQYHMYLTNEKEDKLIPLNNKYYILYDNNTGIYTLKKDNSNLYFGFAKDLIISKIKPELIVISDEQIQKLFDQY